MIASIVEANPFESPAAMGFHIRVILGTRRCPQIRSLIIQAVSVSMVNVLTRPYHDLPVHVKVFSSVLTAPNRIERAVYPLSSPLESGKIIKIGIIDQRDLPLAKLDCFHLISLAAQANMPSENDEFH